METGGQLFQRIQQLQAQQVITPNPAYQPPPPSSTSLFSPSEPANLFAPPAQISAFGSFVAFQPALHDPPSASRRTATPKEGPEYYPASPAVDEERTLGEFEHFWKLPIEIIGLVVEQCALQDGVCLSLASKHMYTLARPILLRRDKEAYSLSRMSKHECKHFLSKTGGHRSCSLKSCRNTAAYSGQHCVACTSCPLYVRLGNGNWAGLPEKTYAYCSTTIGSYDCRPRCGKFKPKKKFWKGKCLHGGFRPRPRKQGQGMLTWTHQSQRGGWQMGGKASKSLYMESDLRKFQNRYLVERKSSGIIGGYSLRRKPKPTRKRVEHVNLRYGVDLENPSGRGPVEGTEGWDVEVQE